jgi:hypothetical protein
MVSRYVLSMPFVEISINLNTFSRSIAVSLILRRPTLLLTPLSLVPSHPIMQHLTSTVRLSAFQYQRRTAIKYCTSLISLKYISARLYSLSRP